MTLTIHWFKRIIFVITLLLTATSCKQKEIFISYSNPYLSYMGRIDSSGGQSADLYWPGSSIQMNFEGKAVYAKLKDASGDNYYNIMIDQDEPFLLRPDTTKMDYLLASGLSEGKHTVEIFRRTEWDRGKTSFYGFRLEGDAKILERPPSGKKKIEFYGNSISAGYAVEDFSGGDSPDSTFTNNYNSYAAITARYFKADYQCICKGGIGILISWFPLIMPEMYNRTIPEDPNSRWDFSLYTPDVVVINLFQNDSWLVNMPDHGEFKARFGTEPPDDKTIINAYIRFVKSLRKEYPEAKIICMLGNMDATREGSPWPGYIEAAVKEIGDPDMYTHFVPYKNTPGHPTIAEHEEMANSLIQFIEENIEW